MVVKVEVTVVMRMSGCGDEGGVEMQDRCGGAAGKKGGRHEPMAGTTWLSYTQHHRRHLFGRQESQRMGGYHILRTHYGRMSTKMHAERKEAGEMTNQTRKGPWPA